MPCCAQALWKSLLNVVRVLNKAVTVDKNVTKGQII